MKKKSSSSSSSSVYEANGVEDEVEPQGPSSSCALVELQYENGEQTLVPPHPNPNLDDGFYEIETIRRKRLRKGQVQFLIKWCGWPETANTWEPLENLQSVPDLIDAFEESLKSGKHRKRKRKHVDVVQHTQLKKRSERSTTSYSLRHFPPQTNAITTDYDPKLSELKAPPSNTTGHVDQLDNHLAIHFQQPIQTGRCCRGAKRRKSASVKRFKRDTQTDALQPAACTPISGPIKMADANTACNIVKIIKPIGYTASLSDNMHDVLVTFMAMRSDGTEVMVDNRYLKAYNPLLLINFYEMHLRYTPTP